MHRCIAGALWCAVIILLFGLHAMAAPPRGADPALGPFFQGLMRPDTGTSCCDISDCSAVDSRTSGDHYQALADGAWIDIPNEKVIRPRTNPTGQAVLCKGPGPAGFVYCFAPAIET